MNDLIHKIVGIIIEAGQSDTKKFRLGETIRYSPSEILEILKQHESEIFGVDVINLRPCPFCGRTDTLHFDRYQSDGEWWGYIECTECIMTGPVGKLKKDVVEAWNRRAKDD